MPVRALAPLLCLLLPACDGVTSDFALTLQPREPIDQAVFDGDVSVRLLIREGDDHRLLGLDARRGQQRRDGLPPLMDAWVGLLVESPPRSAGAYDPDRMVAFGEVGPFDLARDAEVASPVLVAETGRLGDLENLPEGASAVGAALALTPDGDAWLFGGADAWDPLSTLALPRQLRLTDLHGGDWRFEDAGAMPSVFGTSARFEPTATPVVVDGAPAVLVAGGRANGASPSGNHRSAFLLDAGTRAVIWSGATVTARSGHQALLLDSGRVLLVGGLEGEEIGAQPANASFEIFDPATRTFEGGEALDVPARDLAVASLGPDGALVCGGAFLDEDVRTPSATCQRISQLGQVLDAAPLPSPRAGLAMAPLGRGEVLATGGVGALARDATSPASAEAWRYVLASDAWTRVGDLPAARAHHAMVAMPDGRVVVVGGAESIGPAHYDVGAPVGQLDRYDPHEEAFFVAEVTATGAGAWPLIAEGAPGLALVLSGWTGDGGTGRSYGVVGLGPAISR